MVAVGERHGRLGRRLLLAGLLGLALLLSHPLLLATERHASDRSTAASHGMRTRPVAHAAAMAAIFPGAGDADAEERRPLPIWEECFAPNAILPVVLLLLALLGASRWFGRGSPVLPGLPGGPADPRAFHPPRLAPARRRALLQVFLN